MTETKRKRRGRPKKQAVQLSEKDQQHFEKEMKDSDEETKQEWLKRRALEDQAIKDQKKVVDKWYVKVGNKLVRKTRNGQGSVLTNYVGNYVNHPEILTEEVEANLRGK